MSEGATVLITFVVSYGLILLYAVYLHVRRRRVGS